MSEATDEATQGAGDAGHGGDEPTVEELQATIEQLRKDLWTARDAVIGAEAEAGTLKIRNRELEILIAQLRDALAAQTRWARLVAKATGNRYVSTLITKLKSLLRP
jgi:hypothetical protein